MFSTQYHRGLDLKRSKKPLTHVSSYLLLARSGAVANHFQKRFDIREHCLPLSWVWYRDLFWVPCFGLGSLLALAAFELDSKVFTKTWNPSPPRPLDPNLITGLFGPQFSCVTLLKLHLI